MEDRLRLRVVGDGQVDRIAFRRTPSGTGVRADASDAGGVPEAAERLAASPLGRVFPRCTLPDGGGPTVPGGARAAGIATPGAVRTGGTSEELRIERLGSGAADLISEGDPTPERLAGRLARVRGAR